jgi:murein DD-endopeptidase MepM/ murein hydrolase activator NlpD
MINKPYRSKIIYITLFVWLTFAFCVTVNPALASNLVSAPPVSQTDNKQIFTKRLELFEKVSLLTGIPWYYLAAIDQYESSLNITRKHPPRQGILGVYISESDWVGPLNPNQIDMHPLSIALFRGLGKDGSGDGLADRNNDLDLLAAVTTFISAHGIQEEDLQIGLWDYYQNSRSVQRIKQFAQIYAANLTLNLYEHSFPLPIRSNYSYKSTWGASRGWGGLRIHEGTDLFAGYGVPVISTSHGIIEVMGWNPFGGWRIGIRDLNNVYHYYAHLSSFNKNIKKDDIVKPGQIIGWVGSSGYGKPGSSGKFPPHLHYGLYRDNGMTDWSFDPYSYLRKWEREDKLRLKGKKNTDGLQ